MNTSQEHREQILGAALAELKEKMTDVVSGIASSLYSDYLPHVDTDTESNITYRAQGCVRNLMAGNFRAVPGHETLVEVADGYGCNYYIQLDQYSNLVKPVVDAFPEVLKSERIKQLEQEVKSLRELLNNRHY